MRSFHTLAPAVVALLSAPALAVINPYTEQFSGPAANWSSSSTFTPLSYPLSGGPDGSAYGSSGFGFAANSIGDFPILFRAQNSFGSSGGAFSGDWLGAGVTSLTFSVRDNAPAPVTFFARFSSGGPGVVSLQSVAVQPNTWTTFTVQIDPLAPFIYEGSPALFTSTFTNMDRLQIGVVVDAGLAGQPGPYTFDIDNVGIVPSPATGAVLVGALGLAGLRRRRG